MVNFERSRHLERSPSPLRIRLRGTPEKTKIAWPKRNNRKCVLPGKDNRKGRKSRQTSFENSSKMSLQHQTWVYSGHESLIKSHLAPHVTMAARTSLGSKCRNSRGPARGKAFVAAALSAPFWTTYAAPVRNSPPRYKMVAKSEQCFMIFYQK